MTFSLTFTQEDATELAGVCAGWHHGRREVTQGATEATTYDCTPRRQRVVSFFFFWNRIISDIFPYNFYNNVEMTKLF